MAFPEDTARLMEAAQIIDSASKVSSKKKKEQGCPMAWVSLNGPAAAPYDQYFFFQIIFFNLKDLEKIPEVLILINLPISHFYVLT